MNTFKSLLTVLSLFAFLVVLTAPMAMADTFDLTIDHCSGGCGPLGTVFGTVTVIQDLTNVDVNVHLNSPYVFAKSGAGDDQAFKFNLTGGETLANINITSIIPGQTLIADTGTFTGDHTGTFGFGIQCTTCGGGLSNTFSGDISFQVTNAAIADIEGLNDLNFVFAADLGNPLTGITGPVATDHDAPGPAPVPEPSSIVLLGSALIGLGFVRKRSQKN